MRASFSKLGQQSSMQLADSAVGLRGPCAQASMLRLPMEMSEVGRLLVDVFELPERTTSNKSESEPLQC